MDKKIMNVSFNVFDIKAVNIDGTPYFTFKGYGSTFDNMDLDGDVACKGCFTKSLKEHKPALLWQHDQRQPIGVFDVVREDEKGLYIEARLPMEDTLVSGRVIPQIKAGSITSMSIGFNTVDSKFDTTKGCNYLLELKLWEISLVTIPANPQATITDFKNLEEAETLKELSNYLKNYGLSNKKCNIIVSKIKQFAREEQAEKDSNSRNEELNLEEIAELFKQVKQIKLED